MTTKPPSASPEIRKPKPDPNINQHKAMAMGEDVKVSAGKKGGK